MYVCILPSLERLSATSSRPEVSFLSVVGVQCLMIFAANPPANLNRAQSPRLGPLCLCTPAFLYSVEREPEILDIHPDYIGHDESEYIIGICIYTYGNVEILVMNQARALALASTSTLVGRRPPKLHMSRYFLLDQRYMRAQRQPYEKQEW